MNDRCPSCNVLWTQHPGIAGICDELQRVKDERDRLRGELELAKMERNRAHVDAWRKLSKGPTVTMPAEVAGAYEEVARAVEAWREAGDFCYDEERVMDNALEKLRKAGVTK